MAKQTQQLIWWKKYLGKYFLCHITEAMIAEIRDEKLLTETTYRGDLRSRSTANRYLAALSQAFTTAVKEWGWIKENPVSRVKRPKEGKARDRYLEKDEITRLLAECRNSQSPHLSSFSLFWQPVLVKGGFWGTKPWPWSKRYSHLSVSATSRALQRMNQEILGDLAYG